jgi:hypothetical protein
VEVSAVRFAGGSSGGGPAAVRFAGGGPVRFANRGADAVDFADGNPEAGAGEAAPVEGGASVVFGVVMADKVLGVWSHLV